jgi:two-component system cell cycle sensor histidine kinase/response regulator CckA
MLRTLAALLLALGSAALLLWEVADTVFVGAFLAALLGLGGAFLMRSRRSAPAAAETASVDDVALLRAALDSSELPSALTDEAGELVCANGAYMQRFGAYPPASLGDVADAAAGARRDGLARRPGLSLSGIALDAEVARAGHGGSFLLWRFAPSAVDALGAGVRLFVGGEGGDRLGEAGVMAALVDGSGIVVQSNRALANRAGGEAQGQALTALLAQSGQGHFHFAAEGASAPPLRIVQVPFGSGEASHSLFLLLDDHAAPADASQDSAGIHALLEALPLGLALADRDGRFSYLNRAFRNAAGVKGERLPAWPGDLVVDEDKGPVSEAVRRFARGRALSGDIAVRLKAQPNEPVALTVAGARGLGGAAVLLSLKDNKEEDRLKRQVAQATKMQAVGQLAGGVAHDFNNILTAILGTCDLMLMRHSPGDSDYDDIQQIRSNSNRAAGLTRQLLAFSRQQTLRPQVLQLPDVISEVSNLLKRLMGETVKLQVKHGRGLGAVRADPGQLEQVIVNLAVNARDAILARDPNGSGTLTLQTYSVPSADVRAMGSDILPVADYTALKVSDTGTGMPPAVLAKIFEPFFTTKEVGKGTGLGLSTVYGIVKQSGGFIFAESEEGTGTSFTIYLPVHRAEAPPARKPKKELPSELWGTGTVLLVEDEAMVRAVAERALTRHGYTVLVAENGEAALEILAREDKIDLMISDVVMPTMDGPTTAREARKTHPDLPILFISGYAEEQLRSSIDLERVSFLAKPFSVQKLAESARDTMNAK